MTKGLQELINTWSDEWKWDNTRTQFLHHDSSNNILVRGKAMGTTMMVFGKEGGLVKTVTAEQKANQHHHGFDPSDIVTAYYFAKKGELICSVRGSYKSIEPLEERVESVADVLKSPLKYRFGLASNDLELACRAVGGILNRKVNLAIIAGFCLTSGPHELVHAGVNKLVGGENKEVVVNTLYGGQLYEWLFPGVESRLLFPLLGGYVNIGEHSFLQSVPTTLAPYLMTPIAIHLARKGAEAKSLACVGLGAALVSSHLMATIGDFFSLGVNACMSAVSTCYEAAGSTFDLENSPKTALAILAAGFYTGLKTMNFTYRLSRATANLFREKPVVELLTASDDCQE